MGSPLPLASTETPTIPSSSLEERLERNLTEMRAQIAEVSTTQQAHGKMLNRILRLVEWNGSRAAKV